MKRKIIITTVILALLLLILPLITWQVDAGRKMEVLILDKTVPDQTYREHKGIIWALNHYKYLNQEKEAYDLEEDYIGFRPINDTDYEWSTLANQSDSSYDLIYVVDTYGVYAADFYGDNQSGARSELIYGGLTEEDVTEIERRVQEERTPVIAEFNSFASPTGQEARDRFTSLLGIKWDGWIGRYFDELNGEVNDEIPDWMMNNYEDQTASEWDFTGGGLVFVREDDYIVVLEESLDFDSSGVTFRFTDAGVDYFGTDLVSRYDYWFDVIEADEAEVMARYELELTAEGEEQMREYGIASNLPAVTKVQKAEVPLYYFAGDYADLETTPSFYQYSGLDRLNRWLSRLQFSGEQAFYYRAYLPMISTILEATYKQANSIDENPTGSHSEGTQDLIQRSKREPYEEDGITFSSRVVPEGFEVYEDGQWRAVDIKGINMGMAKPGSWPGEAAISMEEYVRWLEQIADMGANVLRVYTIHPPAFYQALFEHNQQAEEPLYVMHGVWIEEEALESELDAFMPEIIESFESEISDVIDVLHGNADLPDNPGHASGRYTHDVSPYVMGYILGVEWYPRMVEQTKENYPDLPDFSGNYFETVDANAFEIWLAERMEFVVDYEAEQYQAMRPVSFTNWPTTDLLEHPAEPSVEEDLVSVDPNTIVETKQLKAGYFASYHVYPYYPDFLNYEEDYIHFIDHRGEPNNYAGYLNELIEAHRMPLVVAEFGIPASRGMTHRNPFGWNQGFMSEVEQGETVVRLFEDLFEQGAAGGLVFTWQDEWFKRTWNTMELDNPDQRPYWSNVQTNEQRFGLLAFETLSKPLNGYPTKWDPSEQLAEKDDGLLRSLFVAHDEAYLYFMIEMEADEWEEETELLLLLNTRENEGNTRVSALGDRNFEAGVDFVVEWSKEESRVLVDSHYDPFYFQYGYELNYLEENSSIQPDNGQFNPIRYALSKPMTIPSTGEEVPFDFYETGQLREGVGDPTSDAYDSLADYLFNKEEGILEVRIPWLLLNVKDPSQKEILGNLWEGGMTASEQIEGIRLSLAAVHANQQIEQLPTTEDWLVYEWENWGQPDYTERLKDSYEIIRDYMHREKGVE